MFHGKPFLFTDDDDGMDDNMYNYRLAREIHKKINVDWLVSNGFIRLNERPMTTEYKPVGIAEDNKYGFIGEYNGSKQLSGFGRCFNQNGVITEGTMGFDTRKNGWAISFNGNTNQISTGWYVNNKMHGNHITLDG